MWKTLRKINIIVSERAYNKPLFNKSFNNVLLERYTAHGPSALMPLGAFSYTLSHINLVTEIGRYCSLAKNIQVLGQSHPIDWISTNPWQYAENMILSNEEGVDSLFQLEEFDRRARPITIGDDVWIGQNVIIKGGVHIGTGAVVAAGSVVTKDVPEFTIVGGVPAKEIRLRFDKDMRQKILELQWWKYDFRKFKDLTPSNPEAFVTGLEALINQGEISEMPVVRKTGRDWVEDIM